MDRILPIFWVSKIFRGLKFRGHFRGLDFRGQFRGYFKWEIGESTCFFFYNISWLCSLLKGGNSWIILIFLNCWAYLMMALSVSIMLKLLAIRNMSIFQDRLYPLTALTAHAGCILKASIREKSSTLFYRILPALSLSLARESGNALTVRLMSMNLTLSSSHINNLLILHLCSSWKLWRISAVPLHLLPGSFIFQIRRFMIFSLLSLTCHDWNFLNFFLCWRSSYWYLWKREICPCTYGFRFRADHRYPS